MADNENVTFNQLTPNDIQQQFPTLAQSNRNKNASASEGNDVVISSGEIKKFEKGQLVREVKGEFDGFVGIVSRHKGQQRVSIVGDNLLTGLTAYVPSAYCEKLDNL